MSEDGQVIRYNGVFATFTRALDVGWQNIRPSSSPQTAINGTAGRGLGGRAEKGPLREPSQHLNACAPCTWAS